MRMRLLCRGKLSRSAVFGQIGIKKPTQADLHTVFLDPGVYDAYRRLKYAVEGIEYTGRQLANHIRPMVRRVAVAAKRLPEKTPTGLSRGNEALYREICSSPYRAIIFRTAGLTEGRPQYWYWEDRELLDRATAFHSWADMQQRDSALRAHLAGRELKIMAMRKNLRLVNHVRFGLKGYIYRSLPELVIGNLLAHNKIRVDREYATQVYRAHSSRQMIADFYFPDHKHILELIQTGGSGTGSRKKEYRLQTRSKAKGYRESHLQFQMINSEPYFKNGVLQAVAFAEHVCEELKKVGIDCGPVPDSSILLFEDVRKKEKWQTLSVEKLLKTMADELDIRGVAVLKNKFSWLHALLRKRPNYDTIIQRLKANSKSISSERRKRWIKRRDEGYPSLAVVRKLCREAQISTQSQWFQFVKKNAARLRSLGIPSNLYSVYTRLGTWISWNDVLAPKPRTRNALGKKRVR